MSKISPIKEKILKFIDIQGISKYQFYKDTGIARSTLDKDSGISEENIAKFIAQYPNVNIEWLFLDKGEIFRRSPNVQISKENGPENGNLLNKTVTEDKKNAVLNAVLNAGVLDKIEENTEYSNLYKETKPKRHLIPFYDIQAIAGRYSEANMTPVMASTEMIDAGDWFHDATAAMRIYGDSMTPDYKSGSIVALKEVHDKRIILYGDDYVVETNEIRVLKRLQRADERGCWLACSTNQEIWEQGPQKGKLVHEPFEIPVDMVRHLYLVIGEVNRKHGNIINFNER